MSGEGRAEPSRLLEVRGLATRRGRGRDAFELRVPHFELRAGEVVAILGPNGSGKTTLLRALGQLDRSARGEWRGVRPEGVSVVFQRPVAFSGSVAHNVGASLLGKPVSPRERKERVSGALDRFGIAHLARHDARTLSGGELRRLALARAFVLEPRVLLLDEPFDDLDSEGQRRLSLDLQAMVAETGMALAIVTHDLRRALLLADRIVILERGAVAQIGARDEVLMHPASREIAKVVGMTNLATGHVVRRESEIAWIEIGEGLSVPTLAPLAMGLEAWIGIRPEHLKIDVGRGDGWPIGKARVESLVSDGLATVVALRVQDRTFTTHLLAGRGLDRRLAPGDPVSLAVQPEHVHARAMPSTAGAASGTEGAHGSGGG